MLKAEGRGLSDDACAKMEDSGTSQGGVVIGDGRIRDRGPGCCNSQRIFVLSSDPIKVEDDETDIDYAYAPSEFFQAD